MLQYKYNPQNAPFNELKKTFTARKELLSMMLDELKNMEKSTSNQHYLVIGPRGIGKTNFLQMIYHNIKEDSILSNSFIPIQFAEEEYSIGNLREIFEKIIEILKEEIFSVKVEEFLEQLQSETNNNVAAERAIEFLKDKSKSEKKKFIVFVDNLDLILDEQIKDKSESKKLRDILMNENFMVLIGAAPTYFDEISKYDKPLYNFFKIINLDELDEPQVEELIKKRAEFDENFELIEKLEKYKPKIKALKHLTGGNPRLILMIYQILSLSEFSEVKSYLNELLDDLTPYYQYKLKMLAPQQRKIIEAMAKLNKAVTPTEISKTTRLEVNKVSSNIKRLTDDGYIKLSKQERRKSTLYIISERLFRIWYQMRHSRSMKRKIEIFIEFIQIWYSTEDLIKESKKLSDKFYKYLSANETSKAKNIIEHLDYIAAANFEITKKYKIEDNVIQMMFDINDLENVERKLLEKKHNCEKSQDIDELCHICFGLGLCYAQKRRFNEAVKSYDEAIKLKPNDQDSWNNRGVALADLEKYEEAVKSFDEALELKPDLYQAWGNRGNALLDLSKYEEAIKSYDEAIKLKPDLYIAWNKRGDALADLEKYEEAVKSYDEAIKLKPDFYQAWGNRGNAFANLGKYEEAIKSYDEALKLKPDLYQAWSSRGNALVNLEKYEEAVKSFDEALELKPDLYQAWGNRGNAFSELEMYNDAIKSYENEIKLKPDDYQAWFKMGIAFFRIRDFEKSIKILNEGIKFVKDNDGKKFFFLLIMLSNIAISANEFLNENIGNSLKTFKQGLDYLEMAENKQISDMIKNILILYFDTIISPKNAKLVNEFLSEILQKGFKNQYEFLESYRIATEYWLKEKDKELVLDSLNPEVREIVEKIINKETTKGS